MNKIKTEIRLVIFHVCSKLENLRFKMSVRKDSLVTIVKTFGKMIKYYRSTMKTYPGLSRETMISMVKRDVSNVALKELEEKQLEKLYKSNERQLMFVSSLFGEDAVKFVKQNTRA